MIDEQSFEKQVRVQYRTLTQRLIRKQLSITTMESITGGQIASLITDTEGSSAIFPGAFVTYTNRAKMMQGVPEKVIAQYSVYSRECAEAMAEACRTAYNTDIGIGVTGNAENVDPFNVDASKCGIVYYAISIGESTASYVAEIKERESRLGYKMAAAEAIVSTLLDILSEDL